MPPTRSRAAGLAVAVSLSLVLGGMAAPASAADDPEAAVNELFDAVENGDFPAVESVVCEAERGAVRQLLDPGAQLGLGDADSPVAALTFVVEDRIVELISQEGDEATVRVGGTMSMDIAEDELDELARAMLEAEMGGEASEEDLERMLPFIEMAFSQSLPLDEEITVVSEDGQWVVCGGLGEVPEEPDYGFEASVSTEGLCALVSPDELSAVGGLTYDSSSGFETFCSYSTSDFQDYHATSVSVELDQDVERMAGFYGADQPLQIAGATAFATGPETFSTNLLTQAGQDVLIVSVLVPESAPADLDWLTQATLVTELFMPRVSEARVELAGPTPAPTPVPTPEVSLCDALPIEALNERTGLGFDEASGDAAYCGYISSDGEPGFHSVTVSMAELALDNYLAWLPDMTETSVADLRALEGLGQLIVELPGGYYTLSVSGWLDATDETAILTDAQLRQLVVELLLPVVTVPEPTISFEDQVDLEALEAFLEDPDSTLAFEQGPTLAKPLCEYVDLDAVNALGILEYDTVNGFFDEICSLSQSDFTAGYSEISMLQDGLGIENVRGFYADAVEVEVAGRPGLLSEIELRVETSAGPLNFSAFLPDAARQAGLEPGDILVPVAELVVTAIEAEAAVE